MPLNDFCTHCRFKWNWTGALPLQKGGYTCIMNKIYDFDENKTHCRYKTGWEYSAENLKRSLVSKDTITEAQGKELEIRIRTQQFDPSIQPDCPLVCHNGGHKSNRWIEILCVRCCRAESIDIESDVENDIYRFVTKFFRQN